MPRPHASESVPNALRDASRPGAERLQRRLADAGVGSRRYCEELVRLGKIEVNGAVVPELPAWVVPSDRIEVEGRPLPRIHPADEDSGRTARARHVYVMLYKPANTVTTARDPAGRRTVLDIVNHPSGLRLFPVGRLDYDTQGLLLLTNDGELTNRLTHPRYGLPKTYRALVKGHPTDEQLAELERGVYLAQRKQGKTVGAEKMGAVRMKPISRDRDRSVIEMVLAEGRNRQVRRMFALIGCPVKKLVRVALGPLNLKGLAAGQWRELTRDEIRAVRKAAFGDLPRSEEETKPARSRVLRTAKPKSKAARKPGAGAATGQRRSRPPAAKAESPARRQRRR